MTLNLSGSDVYHKLYRFPVSKENNFEKNMKNLELNQKLKNL
jgi:hypothetical protein